MSDGAAWQYLVKLRKRAEVEPPKRKVTADETVIAPISRETAARFIEEYEWLGNVGSAQRCFGLLHGDELLAVACYTRLVSPSGLSRLIPTVPPQRIYQLCRGASAPHAPGWVGSRVISSSLRLLRAQLRTELVVAYADPRAGEIGVVYQAANALYLGLTDARGPGEYIIGGVRMNPRSVYRRFGSARHSDLVTVDPDYTRIQRTKKHRYVFVVARGKRRQQLINLLRPRMQTAPKRIVKVDDICPLELFVEQQPA